MTLLCAGCWPIIPQKWSEIEAGLDSDEGEDTADGPSDGQFDNWEAYFALGWDNTQKEFVEFEMDGTTYPTLGTVAFHDGSQECVVLFTFENPSYEYWSINGGWQDGIKVSAGGINAQLTSDTEENCDGDATMDAFEDLDIRGATVGIIDDDLVDVAEEMYPGHGGAVFGGGILFGSADPEIDNMLTIAFDDLNDQGSNLVYPDVYDEDQSLKTGLYQIFSVEEFDL